MKISLRQLLPKAWQFDRRCEEYQLNNCRPTNIPGREDGEVPDFFKLDNFVCWLLALKLNSFEFKEDEKTVSSSIGVTYS